MELSRIQEEVLLAIAQGGEIYETEILEMLNRDRPTGWREVSQPSLNKTLIRMIDKEMIEVDCGRVKESRRYYRLKPLGKKSLIEAKANRDKYSVNFSLSFPFSS